MIGSLRGNGERLFARMQELSWARSLKWDARDEPWTTLEFAGAMCGEAGEAANVAKKMRRHTSGMVGNVGADMDLSALRDKLGRELGDTLIYMLIIAEKEGLNLFEYARLVFNEKSEQFGFEERF